jgi:hypothetical protein
MSQLLRCLLLASAPIVLAGCQHPLVPSAAAQQPAAANHSLVSAGAASRVGKTIQPPASAVTEQAGVTDVGAKASPTPQGEPIVASTQKQPGCLTGQLADGLMLVFTTFTGH